MKSSDINYKEVGIFLLLGLLFLLTMTANYLFQFSGPSRVLLWIIWLVLTFTLLFFTDKGKQVYSFAKLAKLELLKVVWPTRQETIQTTSIVMIMVGISGFALWAIDSAMMWSIGKITHLS